MMNGIAHFLGQLIGLALFPAVIVWWLRGTRPGRVVAKAIADLATTPGRLRREHEERAAQLAYGRWAATLAWWGHQRAGHPVGSVEWETANDMINYLETVRPTHPRSTRP